MYVSRLIGLLAYCLVLVFNASAQGQLPDRDEALKLLQQLHDEIAETRARVDRLEDAINRLAELLGVEFSENNNEISFYRADDESNEFISYPKHSGKDATNRMLKRIGYSTYHDADHRIPLWVSYRVNADWIDAEPFIDRQRLSWRTDPELGPLGAKDHDYRNSGYSRGHMAMQAILRGRSEQCEREGFMFANAAPQRQEFNAGIWLALEYQVMAWAQEFEDVWVITGPMLRGNDHTIRNRVTIPFGYYKIVTRDTLDGMESVAFLFTHEPLIEPNSIASQIVTIDFIELSTGLDFFSDLPNEIEDAMESQLGGMSFVSKIVADAKPRESRPRAPPVAERPVRIPPDRGQPSVEGNKQDPPPDNLGATVYVTRTGKKYHRSGCRYLSSSKSSMSLGEAKTRYSPCKVCKPPT